MGNGASQHLQNNPKSDPETFKVYMPLSVDSLFLLGCFILTKRESEDCSCDKAFANDGTKRIDKSLLKALTDFRFASALNDRVSSSLIGCSDVIAINHTWRRRNARAC